MPIIILILLFLFLLSLLSAPLQHWRSLPGWRLWNAQFCSLNVVTCFWQCLDELHSRSAADEAFDKHEKWTNQAYDFGHPRVTAGWFPSTLPTTSITYVIYSVFSTSEMCKRSFAFSLFWLRWSGNIWFNFGEMMLASILPPPQRSDVKCGLRRAQTEAKKKKKKPCSHSVFFPCEKKEDLLRSRSVSAMRLTLPE